MAAAGNFGGAAGLVLGGLLHGQGWLAVALLVLVAGISALMTAAGATAAITGLQLLVYTILGTGPLGALRPWWWPPLLMLGGVGWAMLLLVPAWLTAPLAAEQRSTADAYRALARGLRAAGTPEFPEAHQAVVTALNQAWDDLASRRARASGRDPELNRVAALLRQTHPLTEAAVTLVQEGVKAPPGLVAKIDAIAGAIQYGTRCPQSRPARRHSPAAGRWPGAAQPPGLRNAARNPAPAPPRERPGPGICWPRGNLTPLV